MVLHRQIYKHNFTWWACWITKLVCAMTCFHVAGLKSKIRIKLPFSPLMQKRVNTTNIRRNTTPEMCLVLPRICRLAHLIFITPDTLLFCGLFVCQENTTESRWKNDIYLINRHLPCGALIVRFLVRPPRQMKRRMAHISHRRIM